MSRVLIFLVPAVVMLYALIDALQTRRALVRTLPKWLWLVVIVLVPLLGAIAWLVWGRAARESRVTETAGAAGAAPRRTGFGVRRRGPVAPDDDPAFLRKLADDEWSRKMKAKRDGEDGAPHPDLPPDPSNDRGTDPS